MAGTRIASVIVTEAVVIGTAAVQQEAAGVAGARPLLAGRRAAAALARVADGRVVVAAVSPVQAGHVALARHRIVVIHLVTTFDARIFDRRRHCQINHQPTALP